MVWGVTLPLREFPDGFDIEYDFGVDDGGTVYFHVRDDGTDALYSADGLSAPRKIPMTGDTIDPGSVVERIDRLAVAPNGTLAFNLTVSAVGRGPAIYDASGGTRILDPGELRGFDTIHSINSRGEVVFTGDVGDGWGFIRWDGSNSSSVLLWDDPVENAGRVRGHRDALITSQGTIYGFVETMLNKFVVVDAVSGQVLFQAGDRINATANLSFLSFVPGALEGDPMIYTGGEPVSVFEVGSSGLTQIWIPGQAAPEDPANGNLSSAVRNPQGDLYIAAGSALFRQTPTLETLVEYPLTLSERLFSSFELDWTAGWYDGGNYFAANDTGLLVCQAGSEDHHKLVSIQDRRARVLASFGGTNPTPSPAGGRFADLYWGGGTASAIAVDDSGRVMANIQVLDGNGGAFLFENGAWRAVALLDQTVVGGATIEWIDGLRAAGNRLYALFYMSVGGSIIAEYDGNTWVPLVQTGDTMPNGAEIYWIGRDFDANRRGDLALVLNVNGGTVIVVRTVNGLRTVHRTGEATEDGDRSWPWREFDLDLRDDGSLYFIGIYFFDRNLLYHAQPLF